MPYEPHGRTFDEFEVGEVLSTPQRTITEADIVMFAGLSGDYNPLHTDEEYAKTTPFGTRIAHGMLVSSIATGLANKLSIFEGTTIALMEQNIRYKGVVKPGDTVYMELHVADKKESSKPDRGTVIFDTPVKNQRGETVIEGQWRVLMTRGKNNGR